MPRSRPSSVKVTTPSPFAQYFDGYEPAKKFDADYAKLCELHGVLLPRSVKQWSEAAVNAFPGTNGSGNGQASIAPPKLSSRSASARPLAQPPPPALQSDPSSPCKREAALWINSDPAAIPTRVEVRNGRLSHRDVAALSDTLFLPAVTTEMHLWNVELLNTLAMSRIASAVLDLPLTTLSLCGVSILTHGIDDPVWASTDFLEARKQLKLKEEQEQHVLERENGLEKVDQALSAVAAQSQEMTSPLSPSPSVASSTSTEQQQQPMTKGSPSASSRLMTPDLSGVRPSTPSRPVQLSSTVLDVTPSLSPCASWSQLLMSTVPQFTCLSDDVPENLLQSLSLRACQLGDEEVKHLSQALATHPHLTSLNLYGNHITDVGVGHLTQALRTNRSLKSIDLSSNHIKGASLGALAEVLTEFVLTFEEVRERRLALLSAPASASRPPTGTRGKGKKGRDQTSAKKSTLKRSKSASKQPVQQEEETTVHPFLVEARKVPGTHDWMVAGNRILSLLNLSSNQITSDCKETLLSVVSFQAIKSGKNNVIMLETKSNPVGDLTAARQKVIEEVALEPLPE
eukprot:m.291639 g.291639  ORF g.291639 m.291639 type:complete len:571 (-) comp15828_c0_seq3:2376-4088(-)